MGVVKAFSTAWHRDKAYGCLPDSSFSRPQAIPLHHVADLYCTPHSARASPAARLSTSSLQRLRSRPGILHQHVAEFHSHYIGLPVSTSLSDIPSKRPSLAASQLQITALSLHYTALLLFSLSLDFYNYFKA